MIKHTTWTAMVAALALAVAGGLSGCGPSVPANPTWDADVYPLLKARCIRCHDTTGRGDPVTPPRNAPTNFNLVATAQVYRMSFPQAVRGPITGTSTRMPPPPAEKLADWEIQILDNWSKEPTPL